MSDLIRVLLVDDYAIVRAGVRTMLAATSDMVVVGEAYNATDAIALAHSVPADVVVMDLSMGHPTGLAATRRITEAAHAPRVLVLTMHVEEEYLLAALDAGASGYVVKSAAERELVDAIRTVARGDVYVQPSGARVLAGRVLPTTAGHAQRRLLTTLTDREREVLVLVAEGHTGPEIGARMEISAKTVETYKHRIGEKLGISGRPAFVRFTLQAGLLRPHPTGAPHRRPLTSSGAMSRQADTSARKP